MVEDVEKSSYPTEMLRLSVALSGQVAKRRLPPREGYVEDPAARGIVQSDRGEPPRRADPCGRPEHPTWEGVPLSPAAARGRPRAVGPVAKSRRPSGQAWLFAEERVALRPCSFGSERVGALYILEV